jgi:hypothetical protein
VKSSNREDEWVSLKGKVVRADIEALAPRGRIDKLSITDAPLLTAGAAQALTLLTGVSWLWLWCDVARSAMKSVISVAGLKTLDVLCLKGRSRLPSFAGAKDLEIVRCNHYMTAGDLQAIAKCDSLREIGAQGAHLSAHVLSQLLNLPHLQSLDMEGTKFTDEMAKQVSRSKRLLSLDVGATRLSRKGLAHICRMEQLRSLDIWATRLEQRDIDLLRALPNLEYVSVGGYSHLMTFDPGKLLPQLAAIPSLRRVWLDGVAVDADQLAELEGRYSYVRVT